MSSKPVLSFVLARGRPLAPQIEEQLRDAIRSGVLRPGTQLPSTRALAADLGVSRGVIVNAYQELLAQGFLEGRRRAVPVVARRVEAPVESSIEPDVPVAGAPYNLRPDLPDLSLFPRGRWLAACSEALRGATTSDFAYGDPFGAAQLRVQLASFLWRTRGVGAEPARVGIHVGSTQALSALCSALRARGVARIGVEDPSHRWRRATIAATGVEVVPIPADANGLDVDALAGTPVEAVVVSPDHNFPYGGTLSDERRAALVRWAIRNDTLVVEHDYDGFFRYDHRARSALQSQAPERVIYVGTASALVAPSLRIGWTVLPRYLVNDVAEHMAYEVFAHSRIHQLVFAQLIASGQLDRHLRRVRARYAARHQLARELLPARGAAAGLYLHVPLETSVDERRLLDDLKRAGVALDGVQKNTLGECEPGLVSASPPHRSRRCAKASHGFACFFSRNPGGRSPQTSGWGTAATVQPMEGRHGAVSVPQRAVQRKSQNGCDISGPDEIDVRSLSMRSPRKSRHDDVRNVCCRPGSVKTRRCAPRRSD